MKNILVGTRWKNLIDILGREIINEKIVSMFWITFFFLLA